MTRNVVVGLLAIAAISSPGVAQNKARPPIPKDPLAWISDDLYPAAAARTGGLVLFTLTVDAKGRPTACRVTQTSGNVVLDAGTCDIWVKHQRFDPARDENGKPIEGEWAGRMRWVSRG